MADVLALRLPCVMQFAVLSVLAHHWNERQRLSWPAVPTIAEGTGQSKRSVQYRLRELEEAGHITAVSTRAGGRAKSIKYRLNLPSANGKGAPHAPFNTDKGCTAERERVHSTTEKGAQRAPEPLRTIKNHGALDRRVPYGAALGAETAEQKRRRQLIELAPIIGVPRHQGEHETAWLRRVEEVNERRLAASS